MNTQHGQAGLKGWPLSRRPPKTVSICLFMAANIDSTPPLVTSEKELRLASPPLPSMYHCLNLAWPLPLSHACSLRPLPAPNYIQLCIYLHSLSSFSLSLSFSDQLCNFQWPPAAQCGLEDQCACGCSINVCVYLAKQLNAIKKHTHKKNTRSFTQKPTPHITILHKKNRLEWRES